MGDPETEVVMPRLASDLVELLLAADNGSLNQMKVEQDTRVACTVMAVSGGYPGDYKKGLPISGLDNTLPADSLLFHAGTGIRNGIIETAGGRVLCVSSYGNNIKEAVDKSRKALEQISYEGMYYRNDIGYEF
jgi:phosphoribosylamine--glycine ligase